jgi:hypothetical protein
MRNDFPNILILLYFSSFFPYGANSLSWKPLRQGLQGEDDIFGGKGMTEW